MRIAFDMSSVMWTALLQGKSVDGLEVVHEDRKVWVNDWTHGYERAINMMKAALDQFRLAPRQMILVFEGKSSKKQRLMIDASYKETRDTRPPEAYEQFAKLKEVLERVWRGLGALIMEQDFVEGDDILAWLAKHTEEDLVVVSNDGDLLALDGKNEYGATITARIGGEVGVNKYGPFPFDLVVVYKSLVGDDNDNIKGCVGFGAAAWLGIIKDYGEEGLYEMKRMLEQNALEELAQNAETDKVLRKVYNQREQVIKSYRVAKLRPEWVDTLMHPLRYRPGVTLPPPADMPDKRLEQWYGKKYLVPGAKFASATAWARPLIAASEFVGLDIETSSPPESDDWLAAQSKDGDIEGAVDVMASEVTGLSLTFGDNLQYSVYFPVDHADTDNCRPEDVRDFVMSLGKPLAIQNAQGFELPVLLKEWDVLLPNAVDTRIEAVYFDENRASFGLKGMSKDLLNYEQIDYKTVTTVEEDGVPVQKRMNQLTGQHVLIYGCDDTITCSSLHNFFKFKLGLEHQYDVFLEVETDAMYLQAKAFLGGVPLSMAKLTELKEADQAAYDKAWAVFRGFLISNGWAGTVPPTYSKDITAAQVKEAYEIVTGEELETKVRLIPKLAAAAREAGQELFASMLEDCAKSAEGAAKFTDWVRSKFTGEPIWKMSPKKKSVVMYDMLGLPIRLRNAPTDNMRAAGIYEGNAKTDALSLAYALKYDAPDRPEIEPIVHALQQMQVVLTRMGLYYKPYPNFVHWQTGLTHPQGRQSATNTRRHTFSKFNAQQMSKHPKADGEDPKVREMVVPHKPNAVVVSLDFESQEIVVIADYSRDEAMMACLVGENKKRMHALTGIGILNHTKKYADWDYDRFMKVLKGDPKDPDYPAVKAADTLGKKTNFTTEYGAMAPKLAETLIVPEEEAQAYIDAKEAAFPGARIWKDSVIEEAKANGIVRTKRGAVRHRADALMSSNRQESSKAERQAVNFKVQSSSAEMTKLALGRMFRAGLLEKYDCRFYFPVHDEVVWSVTIEHLVPFLVDLHACMTAQYADMIIPVGSSISFGRSFGPKDQIEIGNKPTAKAVAEGLAKMVELGHLPATAVPKELEMA